MMAGTLLKKNWDKLSNPNKVIWRSNHHELQLEYYARRTIQPHRDGRAPWYGTKLRGRARQLDHHRRPSTRDTAGVPQIHVSAAATRTPTARSANTSSVVSTCRDTAFGSYERRRGVQRPTAKVPRPRHFSRATELLHWALGGPNRCDDRWNPSAPLRGPTATDVAGLASRYQGIPFRSTSEPIAP